MTAFADLTSPQIADVLASERVPVLLLPVGAIEPHGPHAPLATDPIISKGMCDRAAARLADDPAVHVLTLPPIPYGVTRFAAPLPGAIGISKDTLYSIITEIHASLSGQGFQRVIVVNNHFEPEHVATLRRAAATGVHYLDVLRRRNVVRLTEEFQSGSCHAGRYETSLVLADHPELVDTKTMEDLPPLIVDMPKAMREGHHTFAAMGMADGYCGSPAEATATEGQSTFDTLTDMLVDLIRVVAEQD